MHNKLMCRLDVVVLPFSHSECLLITAKNGNYVAEFTLPSFIVLKPKEHDKNIKGNILSFEKIMIYEFCFANSLDVRKRGNDRGRRYEGNFYLRLRINFVISLRFDARYSTSSIHKEWNSAIYSA
jgi:hypothetical protein